MTCSACGNKSRRPIRQTSGTPVNQSQPNRTSGTATPSRDRKRVTGIRWGSK